MRKEENTLGMVVRQDLSEKWNLNQECMISRPLEDPEKHSEQATSRRKGWTGNELVWREEGRIVGTEVGAGEWGRDEAGGQLMQAGSKQ